MVKIVSAIICFGVIMGCLIGVIPFNLFSFIVVLVTLAICIFG